ncbi:MAG: response regulator [Bdellovibrio sp.]
MDTTVRILVADDSNIIRSLLIKSLNELGFKNLTESDNGYDSFTKIKDAFGAGQSFDIVFLDWNMPMMKGIDVIKKCKADEELKNIVFVMVSAEQDRTSIIAALDAGASSYIKKPFSREDLEKKLKRILDPINQRKAG